MLSAFFEVKAPPTAPETKPPKQSKQSKEPKQPKAKTAKQSKARPQPYDESGAVHAQFRPSPMSNEQGEAELPCEEEPYDWQDAECNDEDDTDSCVTFEDDTSDVTELSSSPIEAVCEALDKAFFSKRKACASEAPVYSGPELWYEDDDFIT